MFTGLSLAPFFADRLSSAPASGSQARLDPGVREQTKEPRRKASVLETDVFNQKDRLAFGVTPAGRWFERRTAPRFLSGRTGVCRPLSAVQRDGLAAKVRDIGTGGVGLLLVRPFEQGALLLIELSGDDGAPTPLLVRVVHVQAHADGGWLVGCELLDALDKDKLLKLL